MLDGRDRLDCVSCPEREADMAEESADHRPRFGKLCLGAHHRLSESWLSSCLEGRVSMIDSKSDDRQTTEQYMSIA
jgi:hypothetical protein